MNDKERIKELRAELYSFLSTYKNMKKIKMENMNILYSLVFDEELIKSTGYKSFVIDFELIKKIDLTDFSFENVLVSKLNFEGSYGVKINPQEIYNKDLSFTNLCNVEINGNFDNCIITGTNFEGSEGAIIRLGNVSKKNFVYTNFKDAKVYGSLKDCAIYGANFEGSEGAVIANLQEVFQRDLRYANLSGVDIRGIIDDCITNDKTILGEYQKIK